MRLIQDRASTPFLPLFLPSRLRRPTLRTRPLTPFLALSLRRGRASEHGVSSQMLGYFLERTDCRVRGFQRLYRVSMNDYLLQQIQLQQIQLQQIQLQQIQLQQIQLQQIQLQQIQLQQIQLQQIQL
jgi:hypothetical protein